MKAMNFKMDESDIQEMKQVAGVYHMTLTDLIKNAVREYLAALKNDPFYRLTVNVEEASKEESEEILSAVEAMTDEELSISSSKRFSV